MKPLTPLPWNLDMAIPSDLKDPSCMGRDHRYIIEACNNYPLCAASPWRPMSEAPKDGTDVLLWWDQPTIGRFRLDVWMIEADEDNCYADTDFSAWASINPPKGAVK